MRLDAALVARGLARSRGHARDLIEQGVVRIGDAVAVKAARRVESEEVIAIADGSDALDRSWVSRAAGKLLHALEDLPGGGPALRGTRAADVGACTGGFSQVLLRRGACEVVAIDVGHGQLAPLLRDDPRVRDLSGHNVRDLVPQDIGGEVDVLVADVSFISLTLVMARLARLVRRGGDLVILIKPQFEVGRRGLDGRGVVRAASWRRASVRTVLAGAVEQGLAVHGLVPSRPAGQDGNVEYVAWLARPDRSGVGLSWQAVIDRIDEIIPDESAGGPRP